jgi:Flp pilus assembly protein TadG
MKSNPNRFVRDTRGQSLIEFALILPMMLVVMFMITEFGRALYTYNVLNTAARAGARVAVVSAPDTYSDKGGARVTEILSYAHLDNGTTVNLVVDTISGTKVVKCTVSRPFTWAFNGPITMNAGTPSSTVSKPSALTLTAQAVMKTETF